MLRAFLRTVLSIFLVCVALFLFSSSGQAIEPENGAEALIIGKVYDTNDQPLPGAHVSLVRSSDDVMLAEAETQPDGRFSLSAPGAIPDRMSLRIERPHYQRLDKELHPSQISDLRARIPVVLPDVQLPLAIGPAFWIATAVFVGTLIIIATGKLHTSLAGLVGTVVLFGVSYLGRALREDLFIFDFNGALRYIDWNVIFLIMGMMIVLAVVERTGIFQWLAIRAYRISGGKMLVLLPILMLITGISSAFLDNVTTMLLMTPISVQIALVMGINPLVLLIPEVMASNVIGVSTLIGTPTNILIGSFAGISFNDFLTNLTPGVVLSFVGLLIYSCLIYRRELTSSDEGSTELLEKLRERGKITEPEDLQKAGWVGLGMLLLFIFGEKVHLLPAVTALAGATALMLWIKPDIQEMIEAVDWTTLVFFISLFIVVGAVREVGLIGIIANMIGRLVGDNLLLGILVVTWLSAICSMVIANIPFTAAMLSVVGFLTSSIPSADNNVLFYCLSIGAAMGGNGSLIGASANMITAGISNSAGYPITYSYFLKKGFPALIITVSLALIWLLIRFM
jgi:Na+/H+ antiporter NhaD/arsenite permease-like protein